ncbi:exocyst complex component sec8 [Fusarium oxysporum NRRL 32931]|uniref:Exocyst complex component Sec8 n=1 Tax=Fusarium oxysporum NRRL 32931 TaxID=660029 RepID=W9IUY2_FUSOX|nr:exocyst complex component sec8 [Fusarium oxysporum NRRL 32931]
MSNRYDRPHREGNGYGNFGRSNDDYRSGYQDGYGSDRYATPPATQQPRPPPSLRQMSSRSRIPQGQAPPQPADTHAARQITEVIDHIKKEWPAMCQDDCVPVQLALQLLDRSSVGRAHEYAQFQQSHNYLQESLKGIVHEHHQGFNSSIGTFHKIQSSIQQSQKRVRALKESLASSKTSLCATDPELKKLSKSSQEFDALVQTLNELDDLRAVPDQLEARISEKRFLTAVEVLQNALRKLRKPELDDIGALTDLRSYLANQETALMDILVEELHEHLYLKSPYCQERWQSLAKTQGAVTEGFGDIKPIAPFHVILDAIDVDKTVREDPMKNPEADTFYYVGLLVESLNRLGRLQNAVETLKQRLPVELFTIVNETINEVDQRHPSSLRGGSARGDGLHVYGTRETQVRADVIYDLLWSLYGKFEAIGEGHRVFHESIKVLIRREGAGNNSALLGSFKELWNLYQNEIRSLLHNYVTTDADVYQFDSPNPGDTLHGKKDIREHLFKFSEANTKSVEMTSEYDALDNIIQDAVPGLGSRKQDRKGRNVQDGGRRGAGAGAGSDGPFGNSHQTTGSYKSLVEPSVFNMSLLLPPTLVFLQRLKNIVPPGSDLAASTLTTFLDNFLVNVFQPQLDETLAKLSDTVFGEADAFTQDPAWNQVARRPVFRGTTAFFEVVTAFCRMLGTIPPDQALSSLIVTQMMRYYDRCFSWFKTLVVKAQDPATEISNDNLRSSARFSLDQGEIQETMKKLFMSEEMDWELAEKEIHLLMELTDESPLDSGDIIQDRDSISSLCLLYTSMKWLAVKIAGLRQITTHDTDTSRQNLPRHSSRRWTLMNDTGKTAGEEGPVSLPLTQETVQAFDSIVSSFEELAGTALLTLHMEIRCRIVHSLSIALSPKVAPYLLDQEVSEPDPQILSLNSELVFFDETIVRYLREKEIAFIRTGLGLLINCYLVSNACKASPMNDKGCGRMQLNILVLQQNLKNVEEGVDLARAANYFSLYEQGADAIVEKAKEDKEQQRGTSAQDPDNFSYDELKALVELCYSEAMANPERGIATAAKRQMQDKLLGLSEHMWQT